MTRVKKQELILIMKSEKFNNVHRVTIDGYGKMIRCTRDSHAEAFTSAMIDWAFSVSRNNIFESERTEREICEGATN